MDLRDHINVLRDELNGVAISSTLRTKLNDFNYRHRARLNDKLKTLCEKSPWREAGGVNIITNLSSRVLNNNETEALALDLKFDSGRDRSTYVEHVHCNEIISGQKMTSKRVLYKEYFCAVRHWLIRKQTGSPEDI